MWRYPGLNSEHLEDNGGGGAHDNDGEGDQVDHDGNEPFGLAVQVIVLVGVHLQVRRV